ncbi:MAG: hypothetical protein KDA32_08880 [Phycisphaerales bacterium]|nr:hypothetical protein [Phycisphaerales bacterium]
MPNRSDSQPVSSPSLGATLLFWTMLSAGAACLAVALLAPSWVEHRQALRAWAEADAEVRRLRAQVEMYERQVKHIRTDAAYVARLAQDGGFSVAEARRIEEAAQQAAEAPVEPPDAFSEAAAVVEGGMREYPALAVFVDPRTRPGVMAMSVALILSAFIIFARRRVPGSPPAELKRPAPRRSAT